MRIDITRTPHYVGRIDEAKQIDLIRSRVLKRREFTSLLTGDWLVWDGALRRVAHVWFTDDDEISLQLSSGGGRYYLGAWGGCSYSGSLDPLIKVCPTLEPVHILAPAWLFLDGYAGAHRGVDFLAPFKVWS